MKISSIGEPTLLNITSITPASHPTLPIGELFLARDFILSSLDESKKLVSSLDETKKLVSSLDETKKVVSSKDESVFI